MISGRAKELPDFQVFQTVVKYCLVIIILPIVGFFSSKIVFDGLELAPVTSSVYSAVVAVLVLHVALGLYIYRAYAEAETVSKVAKKD